MPQTSLTIQAQALAIANRYSSETRIGAPSTLGDPDTVQVLLAALADGNYRETACRLAGISKVTLYNWIKKAEQGDPAAEAFVNALEKAEAGAEAESVGRVRKAGSMPQFWAADMTFLERKYPDRWGRRQDDSSVPKVVVQIGVKDSDVSITVNNE